MRNLVVDLGALRQNVRALKAAMGVTPIYGVCKGNGFGMGLVPFAKTLAEEGIETLAVASIDDAVALREAGLACDILMLSSTSLPDEARRLVALDLIASLGSVAAIETLERAAAQAGKPARAHLKLDTGFGRFGFLPGEARCRARRTLKSRACSPTFRARFPPPRPRPTSSPSFRA